MKFSRALRLMASVGLLLALLLSGCSAPPEEPEPNEAPSPSLPLPPAPEPVKKSLHPEVRVYFDGILCDRGYYEDETLYLAPEAICSYFGLDTSTSVSSEGFTVSMAGIELKGRAGQEYMEAQGRYFYTPRFYIEENDRIYLPIDVIERFFGVKFDFYPEELRAELNYGVLALIETGSDYYEKHFPGDELYWLSRIIYAEARDQPMAGLIGVGNVVYNRVESDLYPYTVFDVIFERKKDVVQFDPAATGGVLEDPDQRSVIAACLCMEGYSTVGDCMFFVNPDRGDSTWFEKDLEFVVSIGDHDFYRS